MNNIPPFHPNELENNDPKYSHPHSKSHSETPSSQEHNTQYTQPSQRGIRPRDRNKSENTPSLLPIVSPDSESSSFVPSQIDHHQSNNPSHSNQRIFTPTNIPLKFPTSIQPKTLGSVDMRTLYPLGEILNIFEGIVTIKASASFFVNIPTIYREIVNNSRPKALFSEDKTKSFFIPTNDEDHYFSSPLNIGNELYLRDGSPIGPIVDIFGPLVNPFYACQCTPETIQKLQLKSGLPICISFPNVIYLNEESDPDLFTRGSDTVTPGAENERELVDIDSLLDPEKITSFRDD